MRSTRRQARLAGLLYLLMLVVEKTGGILGLGELPIIVWLLFRGTKEAKLTVEVAAS